MRPADRATSLNQASLGEDEGARERDCLGVLSRHPGASTPSQARAHAAANGRVVLGNGALPIGDLSIETLEALAAEADACFKEKVKTLVDMPRHARNVGVDGANWKLICKARCEQWKMWRRSVEKAARPSDSEVTSHSDKRPCYRRDHLWLKWHEAKGKATYHSPGKIRATY